jgi:hypothetical protein
VDLLVIGNVGLRKLSPALLAWPIRSAGKSTPSPLAFHPAIQQAGYMKATFQIPDDLYREVKAETARDGRTVREVVISLFEQWLRQKKQPAPHATSIDWESFQAPLSHLMPDQVTDHSTDAMRKSITSQWNEPT